MRSVLVLGGWLAMMSHARAEPVDFLRDVKPILAKHCAGCHGPEKQRAGLRLDSAAGALRGGDAGSVLVARKSAASKIIHAVTGTNDAKVMPPREPRLGPKEIAILAAWIDQGAKAPVGEVEATALADKPRHWSFRPPVRPSLPAVKNEGWVRTAVDRFVLAKLEAKGLSPSPETDRITLLRRVSLDLTGLPPAPEEIDAFLGDARPDAYERLVGRLLASPHYGERWGRHWLDQARYADSNGYNADAFRSIWKYRDWVIAALNRDLPFDRFVVEQLAGDLLPGATLEQKIATGFHRNSMFNDEGGTDPEQSRDEGLVDRVNTTGTVFLGLTLGCTQCHDHKYDPLTQRDYYQLYAFFNNTDDITLEIGSPAELARREAHKAKVADLERAMYERVQVAGAMHALLALKLPDEPRRKMLFALAVVPDKRDKSLRKAIDEYFTARDEPYRKLKTGLTDLQRQEPRVGSTLALMNRSKPRPTYIHVRGDFLRKGAPVSPNAPRSLPPLEVASGATPNRLDLARWIANPENPLPARVTVNRIWQQYFGIGLVETDNDFGTQGTPPSHPELLDWLATEFIRSGWSMKAMHRLIVTSAAYRQDSKYRADLAEADPRNRLLGRQARVRLEAEVIRDGTLAASGLLTRTVGGPSVFPPQPDGIDAWGRSKKNWKADTGPNRYRRGMYTHFWRSFPHPGLTVFDAGDASTSCTRRNRSTTPLQALTLANDRAFFECAQALAGRILREAPPSDSARIRHAFRLCLGREPAPDEAALLASTLGGQEKPTWTIVARTLLNLDEFITRE